MRLTEDHQSIEAFRLDPENESLRVGIQIRAPRRESHRLDAGLLEQLPEVLRIQRIPVVDQEPLVTQEPAEVVDQVPRQL